MLGGAAFPNTFPTSAGFLGVYHVVGSSWQEFWGVGGLCCSLSVVAELCCPQGLVSDRGGVVCMRGGIFQLWESQQLIVRNSSGGAGIDL